MTEAKATVVVTQRERFGMTAESLDSLYEMTDPPFEVIYVDGASPRRTADYLRGQAARRGFTLIRREHFLTPNQARNIGLAAASTPYVVFVDNDVIYTRGWLDALARCAEETGAGIVAPLTCHAFPLHQVIHHAGGDFTDPERMDAFFGEPPAEGRPFVEVMHGHNEKVADWEGRLERQETGYPEFHCVLARRAMFDQIGPLDEKLLSTKEHIDFAMCARAAGWKVWFEPGSVVTYVFPNRQRPLEPADWPFFALRWSDEHGRRSLEHFVAKWRLDTPPDYVASKKFVYKLRRVQAILIPLARRLPLVGRSRGLTTRLAWAASRVEQVVNRALVARHERRSRNAA
jgi:GT2 family glycosyltransferase